MSDLDGDGALDLVPHAGFSYPLFGDGRGQFSHDYLAYLGMSSGYGKVQFEIEDLDRDGRPDVVDLTRTISSSASSTRGPTDHVARFAPVRGRPDR